MNRDLKYIYPVSRVQSIEQLLRVTAHNAFFVVTPSSLVSGGGTMESKNDKGASIEETKFMPQLYKRNSIVMPLRPSSTIYDQRTSVSSLVPAVNSLTQLHTISEAATPLEEPTPPLTLHGIILRSQLVTLLDQKIFFNESEGVRHRNDKIQ